MGENECLGWFPRYIGGQPICNDVGCTTNVPTIEYVKIDTSEKPIYKPDTSCGTITKPSPTHAERMSSFQAEMNAMTEKYKPIIDALYEELCEITQVPSTRIPFTNSPKRKARKYYKPKFTL